MTSVAYGAVATMDTLGEAGLDCDRWLFIQVGGPGPSPLQRADGLGFSHLRSCEIDV